jgi:hypothetical protein
VSSGKSAAAWKSWQASEGLVFEQGGVPAAAAAGAGLPARQGWILRTMAALHQGDRDRLDALRDELAAQSQGDLASLVDCLCDPDEVDIQRLPAHLKRLGIANRPLPRIDLLRLVTAVLARRRTKASAQLGKLRNQRPLLDVVVGAATRPQFRHAASELEQRSRRALDLGLLARALHEGSTEPWRVLDDRAWVDLVPDEGSEEERTLEAWFNDPAGPAWGEGCRREATRIRTQGSRGDRRRLLARLLGAAEHGLRAGRGELLFEPLRLAEALAEELPGLEQRKVLLAQFEALQVRMCWWDGVRDPGLVRLLWEFLDLTPGARAAMAKQVLTAWDEDGQMAVVDGCGDGRLLGELLIESVLAEPDSEQLHGWLEAYASSVPRSLFERRVKGLPPAQRGVLFGRLLLGRGDGIGALGHGTEALAAGAGERAERVLELAFGQVLERGRRWAGPAARKLIEAARQGGTSVRWLSALRCRLEGLLSHADQRRLKGPLAELAAERLVDAPPAGDREDAAWLLLHLQAGDEAGARNRMRAIGRFLRGAGEERGLEHALIMAAGLSGEDSGLPAEWREVFVGWVLRAGRESSGEAALRLIRAEPGLLKGLLDAVDEHENELTRCEAWEEVFAAEDDLREDDIFGGLDPAVVAQALAELEIGDLGHEF